MKKSYNSASNTIDTQHDTHIESVPAYTFDYETWVRDNEMALDQLFSNEPLGFNREDKEKELFEQGPDENGITRGVLIFRIELN